jgi:hypothetical protein
VTRRERIAMTCSSERDSSDPRETDALDRSQAAIDEAKDAAREALDDPTPGTDLDAPGTGEGLEADQEEVTPRPN